MMLDTSPMAEALYPLTPDTPATSDESTLNVDPASLVRGEDVPVEYTPAVEEHATENQPAANVPEHIQKMRDADEARKLYSPQVELATAIPDSAFMAEGIDNDTAVAVAYEVREIAGDMGINKADAQLIANAFAHPVTDVQEARDQAVELLNQEFGQGAKQALLDARKFVARDPRVSALLEQVGDSPQVVLRIALLAREAKGRGQLNFSTEKE